MPEEKHLQKMDVRVIKSQNVEKSAPELIRKSDVTEQVTPEDAFNAGDWITQPYDMRGLKAMVDESTILPQCIRAYRDNIAGFGIGVRYKDEVDQGQETEEMKAEFDKAQKIIDLLNTEMDTKEVFENVIEARETYGIAYLEVIRDLKGEVVQVEFVKDTPAVDKTKPLEPYISTDFYYQGEKTERKKKYCKYRETIGGQTVYFKEFGDPRIMDKRDGLYLEKGGTLGLEFQANEILEFAIGTAPYGEIRWMGQLLGVDGSRRAENLNNNYFINGRHTPLMIMIENGTLSDEAFERLQGYVNDIKGEAGQHAFMVLETESTDARTDFETATKPTVQIKDLANVLQKDELFQGYIDNGRKKVQSAFLLPDIYTGYTTDFNRATAQTAQEVTEKQVFQPERKSMAWTINNRLLNEYDFKYVEVYFLEPNITNPDDTYKMLTALNNAGGLTMNKAKDLLYQLYGETSEDYDGDWGNLPMAMAQQQMQQGAEEPAQEGQETPTDGAETEEGAEGAEDQDNEQLSEEVQEQIEKAAGRHDDEIVAVLKEVKNLLKSANRQSGMAGGDDFFESSPNGGKDLIYDKNNGNMLSQKGGQEAVAKGQYDDEIWRTINGTDVQFGEDGSIISGPSGLKDWASARNGGSNAQSKEPDRFAKGHGSSKWVKNNGTTMDKDIAKGKYRNEQEARDAYVRQNLPPDFSDQECKEISEQMGYWLGDNWEYADTELVDTYVKYAEPYEGTRIYRGMHFYDDDEYDSFMSQLRETGVFSSEKNMSWSTSKDVAEDFAESESGYMNSVVIRCTNNATCAPVCCLSKYSNEKEILSSSDTRWNVTKITETAKPGGEGKIATVVVKEVEKNG